MTSNRTYATHGTVGRKKEFEIRITLPLSDEMAAEIAHVLRPEEPRLDMIREAIEREIKRRKRERTKA